MSEVKEITGFVGNFHVQDPEEGPLREGKGVHGLRRLRDGLPGCRSRRVQHGTELPPRHLFALSPGGPFGLCRGYHGTAWATIPIICGKCIEKCEKALHRLQHERRGADVRRGHHRRRHGHGGLRPHGPRRVRLHPLRERADEHGVRAPHQCRRADTRSRDPADGPEDPRVRRLHPVRGLALPAEGPPVLLEHLLHEHGEERHHAQGALPGDGGEGLLHRHPGLRQGIRGSVPAKQGHGGPLHPGAARLRQAGCGKPGSHPHRGEHGDQRAGNPPGGDGGAGRGAGASGGHEAHPGDACPSEDLRRLLPGGPSEASARGFGLAGDFFCRLRREAPRTSRIPSPRHRPQPPGPCAS